jgi:N-acyl amino acid synthase of PEP-CTERM/exosortase system
MESVEERFQFKQVEPDELDLKKAIYRLRYQVYVEEFGFERPEDHPGGLETDEYEPYSIHMAALENDQVIGTTRLVLHSDKGFPIEHAVQVHFPGKKPAPECIAEISRLAISPRYRRRAEDVSPYGVESYIPQRQGGVLPDSGAMPPQYEKRARPVIVLGLHRLLYQASKRLGLSHWYMIAEEKLWHTLNKFELPFRKAGEPVEYHGLRIPYVGIIAEVDERLKHYNPALLELFLTGLEEEYHPR